MRDKSDIRKECFRAYSDAMSEIIRHVCGAENDVRESESNRYWKACDTLYRLTLHIWDTKASLDRKLKALNAEMKEVLDAEKKAIDAEKNDTEAENTPKSETASTEMSDRFDKREELSSRDKLKCWCIKD